MRGITLIGLAVVTACGAAGCSRAAENAAKAEAAAAQAKLALAESERDQARAKVAGTLPSNQAPLLHIHGPMALHTGDGVRQWAYRFSAYRVKVLALSISVLKDGIIQKAGNSQCTLEWPKWPADGKRADGLIVIGIHPSPDKAKWHRYVVSAGLEPGHGPAPANFAASSMLDVEGPLRQTSGGAGYILPIKQYALLVVAHNNGLPTTEFPATGEDAEAKNMKLSAAYPAIPFVVMNVAWTPHE